MRVVFLALSAVAVACSRPLAPPISSEHPEQTLPRRGGTLYLATFADMGLDPAVASDGLSGAAMSESSRGWSTSTLRRTSSPTWHDITRISPDGVAYRFFLREGVRFHDGSELFASDVKRSIERALHPSTPSPAASLYDMIVGYGAYSAGKADHLEGVVVEGEYVVTIRLSQPDARFLSVLALHPLRPVCPSAGDRYDDTWEPCGAGPYKLAHGGWERGRSLLLTRHEGYFRPGLPYVDAIQWTFGMNRATEIYAFEDGRIDLTRNQSDAELQALRADPRWSPFLAAEPDRIIDGEVMNTEIPPFDNVEVRRAVAAAIDRDHYRAYKPESLVPATQVLPPAVPGYDPTFQGQKYDYAAALAHMAKAGFPFDPKTGLGGYPHTIAYVLVRQGSTEYTGQILAQELAKIGLRLELHLVNWPTFLSLAYTRGSVAMAAPGWEMDYPDPSDFFEGLFSSKAIHGEASTNTAFYRNPHLDDLIDQARRELDETKRRALFTEANHIVCDDAPWAFTVTHHVVDVAQPYVRGFRPHPVWTFQTAETWLDRPAAAKREAWSSLWSHKSTRTLAMAWGAR